MAKDPNANGMHIEYHNVNPKKAKPSDCIYLDKDRICRCKECREYLSKCFIASYCPHKVKGAEKKAQKPAPSKPSAYSNDPTKAAYRPKVITSIDCTLPLGCMALNKAFGKGYYRSYDKKTRRIYFEFDSGVHCFSYPDAFDKGFLTLPTEYKDYVKNDKLKAK